MVYYGKAPNAPPAGNVTLKLRAGQAKTQNASAGWWKKNGAGGRITAQRETEEQGNGLWRKAAGGPKAKRHDAGDLCRAAARLAAGGVALGVRPRLPGDRKDPLHLPPLPTLDALFADELPPVEAEEAEVEQPIAGKPLKRSFVDFLSNLSPYDKLIGGTLIFIVLLSLMALAHSMKGGSGGNMTFVWIAAIVIFGIAEAATAGLVSIWFVAGAVAALLALELGAVLWLQIVVFLAVSIAALVATRPLAHKMLDKTIVPTNADRVLHHTAKVTETIDNENTTGAVYIDGKTWTARSEDGDVIARGAMVTIVRMEGVKLFVRKEREEP